MAVRAEVQYLPLVILVHRIVSEAPVPSYLAGLHNQAIVRSIIYIKQSVMHYTCCEVVESDSTVGPTPTTCSKDDRRGSGTK